MVKWMTSDLHFGHEKIIEYCGRPFRHAGEMNEALISNYNNCVKEDDDVYILGDFIYRRDKAIYTLSRLNGKKYFVIGNHDKALIKRLSDFTPVMRQGIDQYLEWAKDYYELTIQDPKFNRGSQKIVMTHYAMKIWNKSHWGTYHCFGHSHGGLPDDPNSLSMDVGVDAVAQRLSGGNKTKPEDYRPISYEEIKAIMKQKTFRTIDHHGTKK